MIYRDDLRGHLVAAATGLVAPHVLAGVLGLVALYVWSPAVRYFWTAHGIAITKLSVDLVALLDSFVCAILGVILAMAIGVASRHRHMALWVTFVAFFFLSVTLPTIADRDYDLLIFFLTRPFVAVFLASAALGFWLIARPRRAAHVA